METAKASGTIILSAVVVLVVGIVREVRSGRAFTSDVAARRIFGFFAATFLLLVLAKPAPKVAKGLALIMATGAILYDGGSIFGAIREGTKEPPPVTTTYIEAGGTTYRWDREIFPDPPDGPNPGQELTDEQIEALRDYIGEQTQ